MPMVTVTVKRSNISINNNIINRNIIGNINHSIMCRIRNMTIINTIHNRYPNSNTSIISNSTRSSLDSRSGV
jgi:hypothetical protein